MSRPLELSPRARRDLDRLLAADRARVETALDALQADTPLENLDIAPIRGKRPWLRLRVGDIRIVFEPLDEGYAVTRVVNRRDLARVISRLS